MTHHKEEIIRVRFAPSPTGHLHIGGARTALYNFLYARHAGGQFILRIEDTDVERSEQRFVDAIIHDLQWLGISWDEGPVFQSDRLDIYREYVEKLLEQGRAYRCYCTPEELERKRKKAVAEGKRPGYDGTCRNRKLPGEGPFTVRLKTPDTGSVSFTDVLRGEVVWQCQEIEDFIIMRSNGIPTYNFTAVIDDALMGITHVIRGDDHIANTPRQLLIYRALQFEPPVFAHIPLIVGPDRAPLSKRHGAVAVSAFREMGFLAEAMVNYIARLGWGYGDQEIFSMEELIELFDVKDVNRSPATFDIEKLRWMNSHYIQQKRPGELAGLLKPFMDKRGLPCPSGDSKFLMLVRELQPRAKTLDEMAEGAAFFFRAPEFYDDRGLRKFCGKEGRQYLRMIRNELAQLSSSASRDEIQKVFEKVMETTGAKMIKLAQPVRLALTGKTVSPGIFEIIEILGVEEAVKRIDLLLQYIKENEIS